MQKVHPLSFSLGLASGLLILALVVTGMHLFGGRPGRGFGGGFAGGTANISRMAQRFGMTQDELQKELDSGKTLPEIAQEHGVTFGGGNRGQRPQGQSGSSLSTQSASGSITSSTASQASSL